MHRLSTSWLGFGVLIAISCGAPAELDEDAFPGLNETGYTDGQGRTGASATNMLPLGAAAGAPASPVGGAAAAPPVAAGASAPPAPAVNTGGSNVAAPSPSAGGGAMPAGGAATPAPGAATPPAAGGGSMAGGCPSDITVLFNRPIEQGGCNGSACHIPGATSPDLVSPNPEQRLVNVVSQCNSRPYIGPDDSFLADKIAGSPPECGFAMPFFMPQALSASDEACILAWIDEVSGG